MKKIEKMVTAYNKYASKHGYSMIKVDYTENKVLGSFTPKDENIYKGFFGYFKNLVIAGHNASLKADYDKIVNTLKKVAN